METNNLNVENVFVPIPGNVPKHVLDSKLIPYRFTGLLKMTFPNGKMYFGTGIVIAKGTEKDSFYVLTCAHNLYDISDGGQTTKIEFVRAYNDPEMPFQSIKAVSWHYPAGFPAVAISRYDEKKFLLENRYDALKGDINLDYGIVKLYSSVNSVDGFPLLVVKTTQELQDLAVQINGYGWFNKRMSDSQGLIKEVGDMYLRYPISTKAGAAGSAIAKVNYKEIVGIHTRGYNEKFNQGVRITDSVKNEIFGWMT